MTRRRSRVARFAAPAAFLRAATIAILIVRSVVSDDDAAPPPGTTVRTPTTPVTEPPPATTAPRTTAPAQTEYYVIESGDTLEVVADRFGTTVERLLVLNPELDPVALRIGERIRVK